MAAGLAVASAADGSSEPGAPVLGSLRPDLLWLTLDAAAWSHFSAAGYARATTPAFDSLRKRCLVFPRAYAAAPVTVHSVASYLSGLYPTEAFEGSRFVAPSIVERFRELGYRTVGFSENPWVSRPLGFTRGFERFHDIRPADGMGEWRDSAATVTAVIEELRRPRDAPRFVYVHLLPPHAPYRPPEPFRSRFVPPRDRELSPGGWSEVVRVALGERSLDPRTGRGFLAVLSGEVPLPPREIEHLRDRYDGNLAFADSQIGRVLEFLAASGALRRTVLVVTSDHGEAFGEHGRIAHGTQLFEEQIRVPLAVCLPGSIEVEPAKGPVEIRSVLPSLLRIAGMRAGPRPGRRGRGVAVFPEPRAEVPALARAFLPRLGIVAVITDRWKLIAGEGELALYDLQRDPGETRSVAGEFPAIVRRLRKLVPAARIRAPVREVPPELRDRLRALGYLAEEGAADRGGAETGGGGAAADSPHPGGGK